MFRLKLLATDKIPKQWIVTYFDGECIRWKRLTYEKGQWREFEHEIDEVTSLLIPLGTCRSKEQVWVVGWDMYATLCWQGLYDQFEQGEIKLQTGNGEKNKGKLNGMLATSEPTIIDIECDGRKAHCIDFANWSLEKQEGLANAVQILKDRISMVVKLQMGPLADTAAGQGKNRYRRHDLSKQSVYCHQVEEVRKLERDAYYCGRCECFRLGLVQGTIWHLDVKSMYPWIASRHQFPTKLVAYGNDNKAGLVEAYLGSGFHVIARIILNTDEPAYPLRHDKKTFWPTGRFLTSLCSPELSYALSKGHVEKVLVWAAYEAAVIFQGNSQWFFDAREKIKEIGLGHMAASLKHAQNSMYGNMGPRGRQWMDKQACRHCKTKGRKKGKGCDHCDGTGLEWFPTWNDYQWGYWWMRHPDLDDVCLGRAVHGVHQYMDSGGEPEMSCPAIPATMNSYGRMHDWKLMRLAGHGNYIYTDTDSLQVNDTGKVCLASEIDELGLTVGKLSLREGPATVDIRGIKYYKFGDRWCQAGVPVDAKRNGKGDATWMAHEPFDMGMWSGEPFQHKYQVTVRSGKPKYQHGHVRKNGTVVPFHCDVVVDKETGEERNMVI
jgi:hypothetical protein